MKMRLFFIFKLLFSCLLFGFNLQPVFAQEHALALERLKSMGIAPSSEHLIQFAAQGDLTSVELLHKAGVSIIDAEPLRGVTALHNAAAQGHVRIVGRLLELGAPVNVTDWLGATPLVVAAFYGRINVMQMLIAKGADVNYLPKQTSSALIAAVQNGQISAVEMLLKMGAKADLPDVFGNTALATAELANRHDIVKRLQTAISQ
jgi:uncharacterized protein